MTDPKPVTETPAQREARLKQLEERVEEIKNSKGLLPRTPEEREAVEKQAAEYEANHVRYLKSLMKPKPPNGDDRGR
jgi:L-lysine 2,3-aminomutase